MDSLANAESDISFATRRLENAFKTANDNSVEQGDGNVPNPVKIIRRLTALELAMGQLRKDCATISQKRHGVVKSVVAQQSTNVENIEQLLQDTTTGANIDRQQANRRSLDEQNWEDLTSDLNNQCSLLP